MRESIFQTIDRVMEKTTTVEEIIAKWEDVEEIGNGMRLPVAAGGGVEIYVYGGRLYISGYGHRPYHRNLETTLEKLRPEFEEAIGLVSSAKPRRIHRDLDETDGGYQDYRY